MLDLTADTIDVRDIITRYEQLDPEYSVITLDAEEAAELEHLKTILDELKGNGGDEKWRGDWYPVTLIKDGQAFEDYMDELLEDCGDIPRWDKLPSFVRIVVDYDQLKWDYQTIEIDGEDYLYR